MRYRFVDKTDNRGYSDKSAQIIGEALTAISERDGDVKPGAVVDEARPEESPIHPFFEWDDGVAGEQWRKEQAARLIRTIRIVKGEDANADPVLERPFIRIKRPNEASSTYYPSATVMSSAELRQLAIGDAIGFLSRAQIKLSEYRELERQHRAIGKITDELVVAQSKIRARSEAGQQAQALQA